MKLHTILGILLLLCICPSPSRGQQNNADSAGVVILADSRLDILTHRTKSTSGLQQGKGRSGMIRSARGYRIQIYNGNDKNRAISLKIDFMRRFPKVPTYMTYIQPQFRIKVGDFQTRGDAQKMYQQLSSIYSPVMIVPDIVVINTFKND